MEAVLLSKRAVDLSANFLSSHGDVIAFDSGHGFPPLFPDLTAEASVALTLYRDETLQYGNRAGLGEFREWIAEYLRRVAVRVDPNDIVITNGAKQGIELICQVLLDEGDSARGYGTDLSYRDPDFSKLRR